MDRGVILYNTKTGTTKSYAGEIGAYLASQGVEVQVSSIQDCDQETLEGAEYVFLGSWTKGLMVVLQSPDAVWKEFAAGLPDLPDAKLALFTTYKILTGSMFRNMAKDLDGRFATPALELKSRNGELSLADQQALDQFLAGGPRV
jgi:flavodoxin